MNCWEFKNCGRDKDGSCPAYPDKGLDCWKVTGTMCGGVEQGDISTKIASCKACDFYINHAHHF